MDGSRWYYAKWNNSDRERQIPHDFTYMWNLKNKTETILNIENKLVVAWGDRVIKSDRKIILLAKTRTCSSITDYKTKKLNQIIRSEGNKLTFRKKDQNRRQFVSTLFGMRKAFNSTEQRGMS